jgi:hypothetical protein
MDECNMATQAAHSAELATHKTKIEMLEKVFELTSNLHHTLVGIASDNQKMLLRLEHQGDNLDKLVTAFQQHEDRFDSIEDQMGTKDTIVRIHERVDTLEKKDGKKAEKLLEQIKWLLISIVISGVCALVWAAVANN